MPFRANIYGHVSAAEFINVHLIFCYGWRVRNEKKQKNLIVNLTSNCIWQEIRNPKARHTRGESVSIEHGFMISYFTNEIMEPIC